MKLMNGKVFLDTNILVYAHTDIDPIKQTIAIIENLSVIVRRFYRNLQIHFIENLVFHEMILKRLL